MNLILYPLAILLSVLFQDVPHQIPELIDVGIRVASLVLSIIGVTGGLRGVLEQIDIKLKGRGALTLSWTVGLDLTALSVYSGWLPQPEWSVSGV